MTVYIDNEYKCHSAYDVAYRPAGSEFFDGKCSAFIEGYCYVPAGETYTAPGGIEVTGESIFSWRDSGALTAAQRAYEEALALGDEIIGIITEGTA